MLPASSASSVGSGSVAISVPGALVLVTRASRTGKPSELHYCCSVLNIMVFIVLQPREIRSRCSKEKPNDKQNRCDIEMILRFVLADKNSRDCWHVASVAAVWHDWRRHKVEPPNDVEQIVTTIEVLQVSRQLQKHIDIQYSLHPRKNAILTSNFDYNYIKNTNTH
jgi:hypothetical protein